MGVATILAYQQNRALRQERDQLATLSSQQRFTNQDALASTPLPQVVEDFSSWNVYVPEGQDFELRLGIGAISEDRIPPIVGSVKLLAGRHRVTLHTGDSNNEEYHYVVYVDGEQVIEKAMGSEWLRRGWSSASSIDWPRSPNRVHAPLQLAAQSYEARLEFENEQFYGGSHDNHVTRLGYRLWIDQLETSYQPPSPFVCFPSDTYHKGVGLRDGIRFLRPQSSHPYLWTFIRPKFRTLEPAIRVEAEFFTEAGSVLSSQSQSFESWQIRQKASGNESLQWQMDPSQTVQTAFLQATSKSSYSLKPVVEMRWATDRPDELEMRLADIPGNATVTRWRLRFLDGSQQLWRQTRIGENPWLTIEEQFRSSDARGAVLDKPSKWTSTLKPTGDSMADIHLQWQAAETLPLQIVTRKDNRYAGLKFYDGLPLTLGVQIPGRLNPKISVEVSDQHPNVPESPFPGGPVLDVVQIDLDAEQHEWIRLSARLTIDD